VLKEDAARTAIAPSEELGQILSDAALRCFRKDWKGEWAPLIPWNRMFEDIIEDRLAVALATLPRDRTLSFWPRRRLPAPEVRPILPTPKPEGSQLCWEQYVDPGRQGEDFLRSQHAAAVQAHVAAQQHQHKRQRDPTPAIDRAGRAEGQRSTRPRVEAQAPMQPQPRDDDDDEPEPIPYNREEYLRGLRIEQEGPGAAVREVEVPSEGSDFFKGFMTKILQERRAGDESLERIRGLMI
jgi:hypothetical protein